MRNIRLKLPPKIASLSASERNGASTMMSIVSGQKIRHVGAVDDLAHARLRDEMPQPSDENTIESTTI